jgi:hypothetical protein
VRSLGHWKGRDGGRERRRQLSVQSTAVRDRFHSVLGVDRTKCEHGEEWTSIFQNHPVWPGFLPCPAPTAKLWELPQVQRHLTQG